MQRLGFRHRLALWYAGSLTLVLVVFAVVVYGVARHELVRHHDAPLRNAAAEVRRILSVHEDCAQLTPEQTLDLDAIGQLIIVHEIEGEGQVLYLSADTARNRTALEADARRLPSGDESIETVELASGPIRVYSEPYHSRAGRRGVIRVVQGLGDIVEPLERLRFALWLMAPLAIGLGALGGYWLAGRALAPVATITNLAIEIEADRLGRRIPDPGSRDEIGRLVETLNQMIARLEASFDGMKRFTADASHELRGPLATMRSAVDVALSRPRTTEEHVAVLRSVGDDVDRLRAIVDGLLVLARADAGRLPLEIGPVRLDVVAAEVVESTMPTAEAQGVYLRALADTPVQIEGDERWLRQLVVNLVDNAVKFSAGCGRLESPSVLVEVGEERGVAVITVTDEGPGLPPGTSDRIFERFYRGEDTDSSHRTAGFGLGLSIAAWIVRAHGGDIAVGDRPGGGSVFTVRLPAQANPGPR